jgi:Zn-dependent protease with chaperone function
MSFFSKLVLVPLIFVLSYLYLGLLLVPIYALGIYFASLLGIADQHLIIFAQKSALLFLLVATTISIVTYLYEMLFSPSTRNELNNAANIDDLPQFSLIKEHFDKLNRTFKMNAKLFIKKESSISAVAIGNFLSQSVVINEGLIVHMQNRLQTKEEVIEALDGVIAHELSHLKNRDYFAGRLLYSQYLASALFTKILHKILYFVSAVLGLVPVIRRISFWPMLAYGFVYRGLHWLFYKVIMGMYHFLYKFFGRSVEYRCDSDAAAVSGKSGIMLALAQLPSSNFFTLFSTHPSTKRRLAKLEKKEKFRRAFTVDFIMPIVVLLLLSGLSYILFNNVDWRYFDLIITAIGQKYTQMSQESSLVFFDIIDMIKRIVE